MSAQIVDFGVAFAPYEGETISGDRHLITTTPEGPLFAVIDGLGHGPDAARAAEIVVSILQEDAGHYPLVALVHKCHAALRETRGVVMSLASIDSSNHEMTWLGIGNVEGRVIRADQELVRKEEALLLRAGIVGYDLPNTLVALSVKLLLGDLVIMATDGIRYDFSRGASLARSAQQNADAILANYVKDNDDAMVVVVKYLGGET